MIDLIEERGLQNAVDVKATFCFEQCDRGPTLSINGNVMEKCTFDKACKVLEKELNKVKV
jgi:NADH-quinone oxidoreductase subunit G